ncbi:rhamnulokinase [Mesoaciditoga lauensis]|uniref:rhamnulokinase n=1 Tax=Mesoaciditoga lauensis TaxID=1495039 RepID=UPI00056ABC97|nr:rhamnulokinase family protein [Mesoaciditoga lauensis]
MKSFLSIDIGASGGKAFLGKYDGKKLYLKEVQRFENVPIVVKGHLKWNVDDLLAKVINAIKTALSRESELTSIGVDTWGADFGLIDQKGKLVEMPYHYRDFITNDIMEKVFDLMPKEKIFQLTLTHFHKFNTLYQLMALKEKKPHILEKANYLLMMPNLFTYFLTNKKSCEFTIATTTQLYNPNKRNWSKEIISALDLPKGIFLNISKSSTVLGKLRKDVVDANLDVINVAMHDTASAVAGIPLKNNKWVFISTGTWFLVGVENDKPISNHKVMELNFTNEGCIGGGFRLLKNITGLWTIQQCLKTWREKEPTLSYADLEKMAEKSKSLKYIIDVNDPSLTNPPDMPKAVVSLCQKTKKKTIPSTRGEIVRLLLESISYGVKRTVDELASITGKKFEGIHMVGGGTKNKLLCQMISNITKLPVITGPTEAASVGNILSQMIAEKDFFNIEEGRECVQNSFEFKTYHPQNLE